MKSLGYLRGHEIICIGEECFYTDTGEPTASIYKDRPCKRCGEFPTSEDHDYCLGTLPDVKNACCGHGDDDQAYVQLWDDTVISGKKAVDKIRLIKLNLK